MASEPKLYKTIAEKVEPLRKLSGAETAKMCADVSDAMLEILVDSLKQEGKYSRREVERILWEVRPSVMKRRSNGH